MIEIKDLHKHYDTAQGRIEVLKGIDLSVPEGSITAVVGPSGAGKSTLSHCISLLEKPSSGQILVDGKDLGALSGRALRAERRAIGTIFQNSALLSRLSVAENVALPLRNLGVVHHEMQQRVAQLLDRVGLLEKANAYPGQLSGGQRQRVGIARALALRPRLLLSDEATSGLDPESTHQVLGLLDSLRSDLGLSIILITHEMDVVRHVADEVAQLAGGRIAEHGALHELVASPGSATGEKLLPLRAEDLPAGFDYAVTVAYRKDRVDPGWISRLGIEHGIAVALLGGAVEAHHEGTLGRVRLGVRGTSPQDLVRLLDGWGLQADPGSLVRNNRELVEANA
ncbi:methionine ABC transporter ATP-binding protein [Glutamicibacter sp. 0426]|uniref:methionine ABC transporter ATP-binding protein n=1 Tax=Glutamicibacter sp. 0426 TaxID=1913445 RepID=UPI00093CE17D|nr:methionine ABC transporter ATP-binding protein [Glutamicibacter sp. 0426]